MSLSAFSRASTTLDMDSSQSVSGIVEEGLMQLIKANMSSSLAKAAISLISSLGLAYQENKKAELQGQATSFFEWDNDPDDIEQPCTVFLASREILGGTADHQAMMFKFEQRFLTYEANDANGTLIPYWYDGHPPGNHTWRKEEIMTMRVSPKKINQCAKANSFNGKPYSLTLINCQVWAQELAKLLGIKLKVFAQLLNANCPRVAGGVNMMYDLLKYFHDPNNSTDGSIASIGSKLSEALETPSSVEELFNDPEKFMASLK